MKNYGAIPHFNTIEGWKNVKIEAPFFEDKLVPIGLFSKYSTHFFVDPIYSGLMESSPYKYGELSGLVGAYARQSIVKKLVKASKSLKPRHMFLIWDAYRPLTVQKSLFDFFVQKLVYTRGGKPEDYTVEAQKFVSLPSSDLSKPSPHSTGAVVDLTIIEFTESGWVELQKLNKKLSKAKSEKEIFEIEMRRFQIMRNEGYPIEMGTMFDEVAPETNLYFYEEHQIQNGVDAVRKENRRYLFSTLNKLGFTGYEEEWWHYSFGDQFWARKLDKKAKFTMAEFNQECIDHEETMKQVVIGAITISEGAKSSSKLQAKHLLYDFVSNVILETGDIRKNCHPIAHSI